MFFVSVCCQIIKLFLLSRLWYQWYTCMSTNEACHINVDFWNISISENLRIVFQTINLIFRNNFIKIMILILFKYHGYIHRKIYKHTILNLLLTIVKPDQIILIHNLNFYGLVTDSIFKTLFFLRSAPLF